MIAIYALELLIGKVFKMVSQKADKGIETVIKAESDSLKTRLQRKQQEVKERENNRQSHHYRADRGGR